MTDTTNTSTLRDQAEALLARLRTCDAGTEPFDINQLVHRLLAERQQIAAIWAIEDVQEVRPNLTDDQAWLVLEEVWHKHDAELGISWTTLEVFADELYPKTDTAEEGE